MNDEGECVYCGSHDVEWLPYPCVAGRSFRMCHSCGKPADGYVDDRGGVIKWRLSLWRFLTKLREKVC